MHIGGYNCIRELHSNVGACTRINIRVINKIHVIWFIINYCNSFINYLGVGAGTRINTRVINQIHVIIVTVL